MTCRLFDITKSVKIINSNLIGITVWMEWRLKKKDNNKKQKTKLVQN